MKVAGSVVLDLFAGSGAFGAECLSRDAKMVYFFDNAKKAIDTITYNTRNMGDNFKVTKSDFKEALLKLFTEGIKFDIIYLDPPYKSAFAMESLKLISEYKLLSKDGIIVVEHEFENDLHYCVEITKEWYHRRKWWFKVKEAVARLVSPLL